MNQERGAAKMEKERTELWWLRELGLNVLDDSKTEWVCTCPFCTDEKRHFYINEKTLLFDCKKCGEQGNYLTLMRHLAECLAEDFSDDDLARLAKDRQLPKEAFIGYGFGWTGHFFTLPVRNPEGEINNVLRYKLGDKLRSAPDCKMGLFGAQHLKDASRKDEAIYLVEGPWDALAFEWLRRKVNRPGIVTAVMGAGYLPDGLVGLFKNRQVFVVQDNDSAGEIGEVRIATKLKDIASTLSFFRWNDDEPTGRDIRDIITEVCNG
jgi:hypothetical protein